MPAGRVFFPSHGEAAVMDAAIKVAESGEIGQAPLVVVTVDGEQEISIHEARKRLVAAASVLPARNQADHLLREALDSGLTSEEQAQFGELTRQVDAFNKARPGQP
jgi:hypothetical protein